MWSRLIERLKLVLYKYREKEGRLVTTPLQGCCCWMRAVPAGEKRLVSTASPGNGEQGGAALRGSACCSAWNGPALLWCQQPEASLRASVPARAGAGARGIIGWLQPSPCPLICGEQSHPKGTARWWALMCLYLLDVFIRWHPHESWTICAFWGLSGISRAWWGR